MKHDSTQRPLLLLGAYGRGNAGDDVFLHCAIELFPNRTLYINSADDTLLPDVAKGRVQTISTVSPRDIFKKIGLYVHIKEVVYWGGDLWVELYGTKMPRQLLYKMAILNILLRLSGKKIYYVGCGIGKLEGFSLRLARFSACLAKKIVVREQRTKDILSLPTVSLLPDLAVNLPYHKPVLHALPGKDQKFWIIISVLHAIPNPDTAFPRLIHELASFIETLPPQKFKISLLPMHMTEHETNDDLWASQELLKLLPNRDIDIIYERDLGKTIALLRECNLVIGSRLHANILAMLNATPAIGIAYRPKVKAFFEDNGLGDFCLELGDVRRIDAVFEKLYASYASQAELFYQVSKQNLAKRADYQKLADEM